MTTRVFFVGQGADHDLAEAPSQQSLASAIVSLARPDFAGDIDIGEAALNGPHRLTDLATSFQGPHCVVVMIPDQPGDAINLIRDLGVELGSTRLWRPLAIGLVADDRSQQLRIYLEAERNLLEVCELREIPIFPFGLQDADDEDSAPVAALRVAQVKTSSTGSDEILEPPEFAAAITEACDLLVDHFLYEVGSDSAHSPLVARVANLAERPSLIRTLQRQVLTSLEANSIYVPVGLTGSGVDVLCMALANNPNRVFPPDKVPQGAEVIVVCDIAGPSSPAERVVAQLLKRKVIVSGLLVCFGFQRWEADGVGWTKRLVEVPTHLGMANDAETCVYCEDGGEPLQSLRGYDGLKEQLRSFEPRSFWDALRWSADFIHVGHWLSPNTPNHFQFRILAKEFFGPFGEMTAARMRNLLSEFVYASWIDCVISTNGAELSVASRLARLLGLPVNRAWVVRREDIKTSQHSQLQFWRVAGTDEGAAAADGLIRVPSDELAAIRRPNAIVLDQAVHHFDTFEALQRTLATVDGRAFALAVLVDRFSLNEGESLPLPQTRYLPLFRWPVVASTETSCACSRHSGRP